jgi:hypothetical protein
MMLGPVGGSEELVDVKGDPADGVGVISGVADGLGAQGPEVRGHALAALSDIGTV